MKKRRGAATLLRRVIQTACLALFLVLLALTVWPMGRLFLPVDLYLRLDPLAALLAPLATREWLERLAPGLAVIAATLVVGRVFCGYCCPLGITLDAARFVGSLFFRPKPAAAQKQDQARRRWKYIALAIMAVAAVFGMNAYYWGSPIALVTRFYVLLAYPAAQLAGDGALRTAESLFAVSGNTDFAYFAIAPRRYDSLYFVLFFFGSLFALEQVAPRFWCRYLCPAGAALALVSRKPVWRRGVTACVSCGQCVRKCPTGAIAPGGIACAHAECIACRACVDACPVNGVTFTVSPASTVRGSGKSSLKPTEGGEMFLPSRRAFVGAACAGSVLAAVGYSGAHSLLGPDGRGTLWSGALIRPPGSLPEAAFLDRCLRCGQCMKVCPANALQPTWFAAGVEGMFSPVVVPRRGPCEPDCAMCGAVCPTQAITALSLREKQWAKIGTAAVRKSYCLAWGEGRRCMVCQEVCPYGAVTITLKGDQTVPVPVVDASRCYGCGYCENHCPTRVPAIVIRPLNALRLPGGGYEATARTLGMAFVPGEHVGVEAPLGAGDLPPGFGP